MGKDQLMVQLNVLLVMLGTNIAMINAIMLKMILMVVIVVEMMSTNSTAKFVIALKCQRQLKPQMDPIVKFHIGLMTTFVMMKTTLLNVDLMVETVVETMSTLPTAPNVNVLIS